MSYKYARVPFKTGINVICGPNGSGKSSMLVGISVALGQSYTERSKKLSDLIRWGEDFARVTLTLNNSMKNGRRPAAYIRKDYIRLTRILRRDGKYWFEIDNKAVTKSEVSKVLSNLGIDPDNMLVIMHQNMVERFALLSSQDKLRLVEEAFGIGPYRQNVLKAQKKLNLILSEIESIDKLLGSAEQTLRFWREHYDRFQEKKKLEMKRSFLEREIAWTEVTEKERKNYELSEYIQKKRLEILQIKNKSKNINIRLNSLQKKLENLQSGEISLFKHRLYLEREKTRHEVNVLLKNQNYEELSGIQKLQEELRVCERKLEELEPLLNSSNAKMRLDDINGSFKTLVQVWNQKINFNKSDLKEHIKNSEKQLKKLDVQILGIEEKLSNQHTDVEKVNRDILNCKIRSALLNYREKLHLKSLEKLRKKMQQSLKELREALKNAEQTGLRIVTTKNIEALLDEIRLTDGHLGALTDVSDDVEQRYESYSKLYLELKERVRTTTENRKKALKEVETRMNMWRTVIRSLLVRINRRYRKILSKAQATGRVRLVNEQDIEESGLEMLVGFKGVKPVPLDAYIQSGGERSTATMVFLLAVQQHIKSPFRAVDEYDVHMDPKNREIIADVLISSLKGSDAQYLAITPSQVSFAGKGVHVVAIQNVEGTSIFKKMI